MEKLSSSALAVTANYSDNCKNVATGIFSRRFASDTVRFSNAEPESFDVLKHFGYLISKLSLDFYPNFGGCTSNDPERFEKLLRLINQECRNSLIEFEIRYSSDCPIDIFKEIQPFGPFEQAEIVSLQITGVTVFKTNNLRLNEIFPRVRHLELKLERLTDTNLVDCEYSYLDELSIAGRLLDKSMDKTFDSLLKRNKRIRWISIINPTYHIFQSIHEHLKHLDEFHIRQSIKEDLFGKTIYFADIKKLDIRMFSHECSLPKRIEFSSTLEELVLHCAYSDIGESYFDFLSKFRSLRNLTAGVELNKAGLLKLIGEYPNLSEANFGFRNDVLADDIVNFVKESKRLNVLTFMYISIANPNEFEKQLLSQIGEDFYIEFKSFGASNVEFKVQRKVLIGGSGTKMSASIAFISFAITIQIMQINRLLFF